MIRDMFTAYGRCWREAFTAAHPVDRFIARMELVTLHATAIMVPLLAYVLWCFATR